MKVANDPHGLFAEESEYDTRIGDPGGTMTGGHGNGIAVKMREIHWELCHCGPEANSETSNIINFQNT